MEKDNISNEETLLYFFGAALLIFFIVFIYIPMASAADNITMNVTVIPTPTPTFSSQHRVIWPQMGDIIYYGEIAHLSTIIGWSDQNGNFALDYWFNNHTCGYRRADLVIDVPRPSAQLVDLYTFPYQGVYYQHQLEGERSCNPVIEVREGTRLENVTEEIMHQENQSTPVIYDPFPELPDKPSGADYLFSRYDPVNITNTDATYYWVFSNSGKNQYILQRINNAVNKTTLEPGRYTLYLQWQGNLSNIGVFYYNRSKEVRCSCEPPTKGEGTDAGLILQSQLEKAMQNENCSDDFFSTGSLLIQEPMAEINDLFESKVFNNMTDNRSVLYVQGYTNLISGSTISLIINKDHWEPKYYAFHMTNATVFGNDTSMYRKYRAVLPYDPDELTPGNSTVSAFTPDGKETTVIIKVNEAPRGSPVPPFYQKYWNNTEWYPTPTPEIIVKREIVTQEIIKERTVIQTITPDEGQLRKASMLGMLDIGMMIFTYGAFLIAGGIIVYVFGRAAIRAIKETWNRRKD
jgi:hypothetical protein